MRNTSTKTKLATIPRTEVIDLTTLVDDSSILHSLDFLNAVENNDFEFGDLGFTEDGSWSIASDSANAKSGNYVAVNTSVAGTSEYLTSQSFQAVIPGDSVYAECWFKTSGFVGTVMRAEIEWLDKDQVSISASNGTNYTTNQASYVLSSVTATAPATVAFARWRAEVVKTAGTTWCDLPYLAKRRFGGQLINDLPFISLVNSLVLDGVTDNSATIQAAINSLSATNGGTIYLPASASQIAIASMLSITTPNISLVGTGTDQRHNDTTAFTGAATVLKWTGSSGGTMMQISSPSGASNKKMTGGGLRGVGFDANGLAGVGLEILSRNGGVYERLQFQEFLTAAVRLDVVASLADARDSQNNYFLGLNIWQSTQNGDGIVLQATTGGANPSYNIFTRYQIQHKNGNGITIANGDNNYFLEGRVSITAGGTGTGIDLQGSNVNAAYVARNNMFEHVFYDSCVSRGTSSYTYPAVGNSVYDVDAGNGAPLPTVETGSYFGHFSFNDGRESFVSMSNAATIDIGAQPTLRIEIAGGATAVTSFGTVQRRIKQVKCTGSFTLTYNATTMVLPGGADIVTAVNDTFWASSNASGNWIVFGYTSAATSPWTGAVDDDYFNVAQNGDFEKGNLGWSLPTNGSITNDSANAETGNYVYLNTDTSGTTQSLTNKARAAVKPGEIAYAEAMFKTAAGMTMTVCRCLIVWYDKDGTALGTTDGTNFTTDHTTYTLSSVTGTAPANACYFTPRFNVTKTVGNVWVDNVRCYRKRGASQFVSDGTVGNAQLQTAAVTTDKMGGDVTLAGKSFLSAADAAAQTALLNQATPSLKGLMSSADKTKLNAIYAEGVTVQAYGVVADYAGGTGTDNTAAMQAAINAALASGVRLISIPSGDYYFPSTTALDPGAGNLIFRGAGAAATVIHFKEGTAAARLYLFKNITNSAKGSLRFDGITFQGTWSDTNQFDAASNPLWLDYYSSVEIEDCKFYGIGGMAMDFHYCGRFVCIHNHFENIARDCVRARDCRDALVEGNYIKRNGDDAIALHVNTSTLGSYRPQRDRIIIRDNFLVNCGSIALVNAKKAVIAGNHGILVNNGCVDIRNGVGGTEGNAPIHDLDVSNNIFTDAIAVNSATAMPSSAYLEIVSIPPKGGTATNGTIPGDYDATGGTIVKPWNWYQADYTNAADAIGRTPRVRIADNTLARTLPSAAAISSYGYGAVIRSGIVYDPATTDTNMRAVNGIQMGDVPAFGELDISGNIVQNCAAGIVLPAPASDRDYQNVTIRSNKMKDCINRGIQINSGLFNAGAVIEDNEIDCDPLRMNPNSSLDGHYLADSVPWGIDTGNCNGVRLVCNKFRNVCKPVATNVPASIVQLDNIGYCAAPAALGFSISNHGIGTVPSGDGWEFVIEDSDPTSTTYKQFSQKMLRFSSTMPSSGWYYQGWFVHNTSGATSPGWKRLTTGTGHILSTDWAAI